jgi:hypothetical protein
MTRDLYYTYVYEITHKALREKENRHFTRIVMVSLASKFCTFSVSLAAMSEVCSRARVTRLVIGKVQ